MKRTTAVLLFACGVLAWSEGALDTSRDWFASYALDSDEQKAVQLQCRGMDGVLRTSCEQETAESLVAGEVDPDPILRVHCTRFDNLWSENIEIPPNLCIARYGGWLHS